MSEDTCHFCGKKITGTGLLAMQPPPNKYCLKCAEKALETNWANNWKLLRVKTK